MHHAILCRPYHEALNQEYHEAGLGERVAPAVVRVLVAPLAVTPLPGLVAPIMEVVAVVLVVLQIGLQQIAAALWRRHIPCTRASKDCQGLCCRPGDKFHDERRVRKPSARMDFDLYNAISPQGSTSNVKGGSGNASRVGA